MRMCNTINAWIICLHRDVETRLNDILRRLDYSYADMLRRFDSDIFTQAKIPVAHGAEPTSWSIISDTRMHIYQPGFSQAGIGTDYIDIGSASIQIDWSFKLFRYYDTEGVNVQYINASKDFNKVTTAKRKKNNIEACPTNTLRLNFTQRYGKDPSQFSYYCVEIPLM